MSQKSERETNDSLRAENSQLEEELAVAERAAETHDEVERALRATLS